MAYEITEDYISFGNARSGEKLDRVVFIVAHDTGNPGSTAYGNRNYFDNQQPSASAQVFIDDKYILVMIPLGEKAWHVQYQKPNDNEMFGVDANDAAIGVELCWGGNIDFDEAYKKYVWFHAYLCDRFGLNPDHEIESHKHLDPERRSDPDNALNRYGITFDQFINDVGRVYANEFNNDHVINDDPVVKSETTSNLIEFGDNGTDVQKVQEMLLEAGYTLPIYGADGDFGEETEKAVRAFQKDHDLAVDGIVGPNTLEALKGVMQEKKAEAVVKKAIVPYPGDYIELDSPYMRGKDVERIQRAVDVKPDGIFGPNTEKAVKKYQKRHGLSVDGIVGPDTWNTMF